MVLVKALQLVEFTVQITQLTNGRGNPAAQQLARIRSSLLVSEIWSGVKSSGLATHSDEFWLSAASFVVTQ